MDDEEEMPCQQPPALPFALRAVKCHRCCMANPLRGAESKGEPFISGRLGCHGLVLPADNRRDASQGKRGGCPLWGGFGLGIQCIGTKLFNF